MKIVYLYILILTLLVSNKNFSQEGVQAQNLDVLKTVAASGYMGDKQNIALYENWKDIPCSTQSDSFCVKINYIPGDAGWAGIYWLNIPNNWCEGRDLSASGYNEIVFYARGEMSGELVEFKAGDITCPDNNKQRD